MSSKSSYTCHVCRKAFTMAISNAGYPGGKDRESIYCPWCDAENDTIVTSGIVSTYKVSAEGGNDK
jgi:transposase-like protein